MKHLIIKKKRRPPHCWCCLLHPRVTSFSRHSVINLSSTHASRCSTTCISSRRTEVWEFLVSRFLNSFFSLSVRFPHALFLSSTPTHTVKLRFSLWRHVHDARDVTLSLLMSHMRSVSLLTCIRVFAFLNNYCPPAEFPRFHNFLILVIFQFT